MDPPAGSTASWTRLALKGAPYAALTASFAATIRTHLFFLRPIAMPTGLDEGYIAALSQRLSRGQWLPYVDGVSQRGPMTYWISALAMSAGSMFSWVPLRLVALGLSLCTLVLVFLLALELFSPLSAAIAVLVEAYFCNYELSPLDGVGYNGELAAMPPLLLSALLVARVLRGRPDPSRRGRRAAWLLFAGVLAACAALTKQIALIHTVPALLWLVLGDGGTQRSDSRAEDVSCYLLGFAVPFSVVLTVYGVSGHLQEFVYYYERYGREIYMAPVTWTYMREKLQEEVTKYSFGVAAASVATLFAVGRATCTLLGGSPRPAEGQPAASALGRVRESAPILFVLSHWMGSIVGATFLFRFYGHYYLVCYPFFGLVTGYVLGETLDVGNDDRASRAIGALVVVAGSILLLALADSSLARNVAWRRGAARWDPFYQDPQIDPVVRYVKATTQPSDTIFVWGFRAETHVSAQRYPASRFVYSVYPSGFVPWFRDATPEEEARRVVPGSQELLLADLESSKPELIVDAGDTMSDRSMRDIPRFRRYLRNQYCLMGQVAGEPVYRRRRGDTCPPAGAP